MVQSKGSRIMAFKRTTRKTSKYTRSSVTQNTNGPNTFSHSAKNGFVTTTSTMKGGKSYTTQTTRLGNGFVQRKRISSSSNARPRRSRKSSNTPAGNFLLIAVIAIFIFGFLFGG